MLLFDTNCTKKLRNLCKKNCTFYILTNVVRKSTSSGLKNRVILPYWQLSHIVNGWGLQACLVSKEAEIPWAPSTQKTSHWKGDFKVVIGTQGWVNLPFQPRRGWFSHNTSQYGKQESLIAWKLPLGYWVGQISHNHERQQFAYTHLWFVKFAHILKICP